MRRFTLPSLIGAFAALLTPGLVFAAQGFGAVIGVGYDDPRLLVIRIFQIFWFLCFVAALGGAGYGFTLMRKDPDDLVQTTQGKKYLVWSGSAAGIILVIFIILTVVYAQIESGYTKNKARDTSTGQGQGAGFGLSTTGGDFSKIASHYPGRDERNIPRNVQILVTFKEPLNPASVVDGGGLAKKDALRLFPVTAGKQTAAELIDARASLTPDNKTISLAPQKPLGTDGVKSIYAVSLTNSIQKAGGESMFATSDGYSWQFEVSGVIDNSPPVVETYFPFAKVSQNTKELTARNALIQITINEAVDPASVQPSALQIVDLATGKPIVGSVNLSNSYRTITFIAREMCGATNSCSEQMTCLPKLASLKVTLKSAALSGKNLQTPNRAAFPYNGIVDTSGNAMDGGGQGGLARNGKAEGTPTDDFWWTFSTSDTLDTTPIAVEATQPGRDATRVSLTEPVSVFFSKFVDAQYLHSGSFILDKVTPTWFSLAHDMINRKSAVKINHDLLKENTLYSPTVTSDLHDMYQNCYNPCLNAAH